MRRHWNFVEDASVRISPKLFFPSRINSELVLFFRVLKETEND